jgi:hypothetical protein
MHRGRAARVEEAAQQPSAAAEKAPPPPVSKAVANAKKRAHALQSTAQIRNPFEPSFEAENLRKVPALTEVWLHSLDLLAVQYA